MAEVTQLGSYLKNLFLQGQGVITQTPGRAAPSVRKYYKYHPGYDISVKEGTPVTPSFAGKVVSSGMRGGYGQSVGLYNPQENKTYNLGHLSKILLPSGEFKAGQTIGYTGGRPGAYGAGQSTGPHVDIETQGGFASFANKLKTMLQPAQTRMKIDLASLYESARKKYGSSLKLISRNKAALNKIAVQRGGRVIRV